MSNRYIGFDHARDRLKQLLEEAELGVVDSVADVGPAEIGIVHTRDEQAWEKLLENSPSGSVRVRTSGGGELEKRLRITDHGVYEFHLQINHDDPSFTAEDLSLIFKELGKPEVAKEIARGNVPHQIIKYFVRQSAALLSGLSILCQGLLAVHTDSTGRPEEVPDGDIADVRTALKKMQWPTFCRDGKSRELLVEAFLDDSAEGPNKRSLLRSQVSNVEYWQPIANVLREQKRSRDESIGSVKSSEWDPLSGQARWEDVETLLMAIWDSSTKNVGSGVVARAFVQLANRLGGT